MIANLSMASLVNPILPLPLAFYLITLIVYTIGRGPFLRLFDRCKNAASTKPEEQVIKVEKLDNRQVIHQPSLIAEEHFQLEKRAFFSKTWLFVCHHSRFRKAGDYHTFDVAGLSYFIVFGKDTKLRAFHNICRHRAYTVVRKSCGTSNRFSCKYHGWQYDDQGKLVKVPKFDSQLGFRPEENGLFEIKLIQTREGLVFINFDDTTVKLPFENVKSNMDLGSWTWLDGSAVTVNNNWKTLAQDFSQQASWSVISFGWLSSLRKQKIVRMLGPLSVLKQLDDEAWCIMTISPRSASSTDIRYDVYGPDDVLMPNVITQKWKSVVEKEIQMMSVAAEHTPSSEFSYECGGRQISLSAILNHHKRLEKTEQKKLQPALRYTSTQEVDLEAEAISYALEKSASMTTTHECPNMSGSLVRSLEW